MVNMLNSKHDKHQHEVNIKRKALLQSCYILYIWQLAGVASSCCYQEPLKCLAHRQIA